MKEILKILSANINENLLLRDRSFLYSTVHDREKKQFLRNKYY